MTVVFIYEVGQQVSFNLGNVTLGSATGRSVLTPVDLVAGGSSSSTEVLNLVRFLLMLDDDGDSSNGINISSAVQTVAENWSAVDFTTANLQSELSSIISDTASADGTSHTTTQRHHGPEPPWNRPCAASGPAPIAAHSGAMTVVPSGFWSMPPTACFPDLPTVPSMACLS